MRVCVCVCVIAPPDWPHGTLGLKKKLFDWRNPTDPIFNADPKYFNFFCVQKKKF